MSATVRRALAAVLAASLAVSAVGCAPRVIIAEEPPRHTPSEFDADEDPAPAYDPWEGSNRSMYRFNYYLDNYFLLPVTRGYELITPAFVQTGVSNFFSNIMEVRNIFNNVLQLKGEGALVSTGRFLTNSTIGIGGLFDWATKFSLKKHPADFGQTLGHYGSGPGPYAVWPVFGPSNVRDTAGFLVDAGARYAVVEAVAPFQGTEHARKIETGLEVLEAVDKRHREPFRYYRTGSPFEYELVRFVYGERRKLEIAK
jgi:phospholipid-binding lipoprotein MlaA